MLKKKVFYFVAALSLCSVGTSQADNYPKAYSVNATQQNGKVTGSVADEFGPVAGAAVSVKGTTRGVVTDMDGNFTLEVSKGETLVVSYLGYVTKEIVYDGEPHLAVTLAEDTQQLDEVVVTALGVKREKKSLGYAMQELKGETLLEARETNMANALSGKISGVQIIRSSNGPGSSSKIQLRGSNSVTGLNQPLIVVDGIPMDNFTGASNNDYWNPSADMGNGLSDINPEDVESMSVLKGASAAALYGTRAGNGVILITTKSGKKNAGLGITISSSISAETIFMKPEMQTSFGQGDNGIYDANSSMSWGPAITGQSYSKWDGSSASMQAFDNIDNYFKTGTNLTENISFSQQYDKTSIYASMTRMDDMSKIPGAELDRTNFMLRATSVFGSDDRWTFDAKVQYINTNAHNRPITGTNVSNTFMTMYTTPISLDIRDFSARKDADGNMLWWEKGSGLNPYWAQKYNTNSDSRNRYLMNASVKYKFTDWLNAEVKAGSDMYTTETESKLYAGSPLNTTGSYSLGEDKFYENNYSFLVTAVKDNLFGKWGGALNFGGNLMHRKKTGLSSSQSQFTVPDLFSLNNGSKSNLSVTQTYNNKKINSLYGTAQVNYDGWLFLDGTFRNDWSSALSKENRSFFYPSVSLSWVISDMMIKAGGNLPSWLTYAKLRASFAQVGNDMDPYQLYNVYSIGSDPNGNTTASSGSTLYDANVRSELISSYEAGAELKLFDNRLGFDFAWYKSNARRQLLNLPMNALSGYNNKKINAGNIQNTGIELMVNASPVRTHEFNWDIMVNFSQNKNKIIELAEGIETYSLGGYDNLSIYAVTGGNYGEIWGTKYLRITDENSPYYGQLLLTNNGLPQGTSEAEKIGDQQADCLLGVTNTLSYKNFTLSFLIDGRFGGEIFSATNRILQNYGTAAVTAPGGARENIVVEGVIASTDGNGNTVYTPNTNEVTQQQYWTAISSSSGNLGIGEANIYDATNIRLRNLSLNYSFPKSVLAKTILQQVKVGVSVNNVWMISSHLRGVDPESVFATSTNAVGFESNGSPTSRSFLFNLTLGF